MGVRPFRALQSISCTLQPPAKKALPAAGTARVGTAWEPLSFPHGLCNSQHKQLPNSLCNSSCNKRKKPIHSITLLFNFGSATPMPLHAKLARNSALTSPCIKTAPAAWPLTGIYCKLDTHRLLPGTHEMQLLTSR